MSQRILSEQLAAWDQKPIIRRLYGEWFRMISREMIEGATLDVGAGIGKFKEHVPSAFTLDIEETPWTDMVGDALCLPVRDGSLSNIVLFDVLHHLPRPALFFEETVRTLRAGGRVLIMDPYISPVSYPVYRFLHPENADLRCDPLGPEGICSDTPFDSNQAATTVLFFRSPERFAARFPELEVVRRDRLACLAYPLSGGFSRPALLPNGLLRILGQVEQRFGALASLLAFRTFVVLEKRVS